nr:C1 family peptidase [Bacteroidaceae bacterium]
MLKKLLQILSIFILFPHAICAQYNKSCFKLDTGATTIPFTLLAYRDTIYDLSLGNKISGMSISGEVSLNNNKDSYARVILQDVSNYEYLVYESYPMLLDSLSAQFQNTAIETVMLDAVIPKSLKIELKNACVRLEQLHFIEGTKCRSTKEMADCQKEQSQFVAELLNDNLIKRNKTWRAGTTSVSRKSYEEKKSMFGGAFPQLYGFDYYVGGVFVMPDDIERSTQGNTSSNQYVEEWDWRNRHGKNWLTPVEDQGDCGSCWAFAAAGTVEPYINLYYNRLINYNLSKQEIVSCSTTNGCDGGHSSTGLVYIRDHGIVLDSCFHYQEANGDCNDKCTNPSERIYIQYRRYIFPNENSFKDRLFVAPIILSLKKWHHDVVLVGYKVLKNGDTYYNGNSNTVPITISASSHPEMIGRTAWTIKNSWNNDWGNSGYGYIMVNDTNVFISNYADGKITSMIYSDDDIICEDADGDGYYFWGVGEKPARCPDWIPNIPDGNDADPSCGSLDSYGFLEPLNPDSIPTLVFSNDTVFTTSQSVYSNIRIQQGATVTVKSILNMFGHSTITIDNGGKLIVDSGVITNA